MKLMDRFRTTSPAQRMAIAGLLFGLGAVAEALGAFTNESSGALIGVAGLGFASIVYLVTAHRLRRRSRLMSAEGPDRSD